MMRRRSPGSPAGVGLELAEECVGPVTFGGPEQLDLVGARARKLAVHGDTSARGDLAVSTSLASTDLGGRQDMTTPRIAQPKLDFTIDGDLGAPGLFEREALGEEVRLHHRLT